MSIAINLVGSSHLRGGKNGHHLIESLNERYQSMDESFKSRYYPGDVAAISGGRLFNIENIESFLEIAKVGVQNAVFSGQVIVIMLGTNDFSDPTVTEAEFGKRYRDFVDEFLKLPYTGVFLTGLVPREEDPTRPNKRTNMTVGTQIIRELAASYTKAGKSVRFIPVDKKIGQKKEGVMCPFAGALDDKVHMSKESAVKVADQILNHIRCLPKDWFPDYSNF